MGIAYVGLCWRQVRAQWLNNVVGRSALEEIVLKEFPLHEKDMARLVNTHFADVLQQIQHRHEKVKDSSDEEDLPEALGAGP